jgi:hypothetical protein
MVTVVKSNFGQFDNLLLESLQMQCIDWYLLIRWPCDATCTNQTAAPTCVKTLGSRSTYTRLDRLYDLHTATIGVLINQACIDIKQ